MVETPLIRHGFAVPPSPCGGRAFGSAQIGGNYSLCGTFGYIYWELGRSAPVGGQAAARAAPTTNHRAFRETAGGASPSPTGFQKRPWNWGGEPLGSPVGEYALDRRAARVCLPCGGLWAKNGGRTVCAPTREGAGTCPLIRPLRGHLPPRGKAWEKEKGTGLGPVP